MSTIEGGMVCTDDASVAQMLTMVRANGWDRNLWHVEQWAMRRLHNIQSEFDAKYTFYDLAYNLRPTEITGFLGLQQLKYLDENIAARQRIFKWLHTTTLTNPDLVPLEIGHLSRISAFAFPVICKTPELRALYLARFEAAGIEVRPMIAGNITRQPFWKKYITEQYDLPGADFVHECGFYCGCYPELTDEEVRTIDDCLREVEKVGSYASNS
jgi:CDP-6-deoxy-D-xylo-4-hexulose-3-dehydrase